MRFTVAISILLLTSALGYAPNSNYKQSSKQTTSTSLGYVKAFNVETPSMESQLSEDDPFSTLKNALGFSEGAIREKYSNWLLQYGKVADESRYLIYKKNFLMQEEYNQKWGASFTLNHYGDMTESKFFCRY